MKKAPVLFALFMTLGIAAQAELIVGSCELDGPVKFDSGAVIISKSERTNEGKNYDYSYRYKTVALFDKASGHVGNLHDTDIRGEYSDKYGQPSTSIFPKRYFFGSSESGGVKVIIHKAGRGTVKNDLQCTEMDSQANVVTKIPVKIIRETGDFSEQKLANLKCFTYFRGVGGLCKATNMPNSKFKEQMWSPKKIDAVYSSMK